MRKGVRGGLIRVAGTVISALALGWMPAPARGQDSFVPGRSKERPGAPANQPTKEQLKEEGQQLFGPGKARPSKGEPGAPGASAAWSILIEAFRGDDQGVAAARGLERVRGEAGLKDAYIEKRGEATVIAYGRYDDPASKQARADLEKVKGLEVIVNGVKTKPFANSFLAPPEEIAGSIPEYDLHNAKKQSGEWVLYTLQIGVYSREDGKAASAADMADFRKAAEQAVVQLRREGEQAFYYHGPRRSMVTVGLFGKDDFDPQTPGVESPALHVLRQRYPYNLLNGMGIRQTMRITDPKTGGEVKKTKMEASALVNVPKE